MTDEQKGIIDILNEMREYKIDYNHRSETGNSKGEHKEYYKGKRDAYARCQLVIERHLRWYGIKFE